MFRTAFLDIPHLLSAAGDVTLPGSKSISNRVLLLCAMCEGETTVRDLLDSDDTRVMLDALRSLGCGLRRDGTQLNITGLGGRIPQEHLDLFLGNAGTAMRPLTAALAVLGADCTLRGVPRMHERPIGDLVDALRQLGCDVGYLGSEASPPLRVGPPKLHLDAPIRIRGEVSSQFLTALLMALPLVARQTIVIEVVGELISKPYIDITLKLLAQFGVEVRNDGWQRFTIPAGSALSAPGTVHIEADASSASYFIALGALSADPRGIHIHGVGAASIQGDIRFIEAARAMGAQIDSQANSLHVRRGVWPLRAIDLDCHHIPDAAMTLAVMALFAQGTTRLRNIASWRVKETDRISAMACELRKFGAQVTEGPDFLEVSPPAHPADWRAARIHTYDDHRVAMCFSLAALNPASLPVRIEDPQCVAKTFPDYFEALFAVAQPAAVPVICIDGPTASGKGTLASALAARLGYHFLDSGALYRISAYAALQDGIALELANQALIAQRITSLAIRFEGDTVWLDGMDVSQAIRTEEAGANASKVAALPEVRAALLGLQHSFARLPGLVADGRDMGTVIFPQAQLKVFLTADAACRAERRFYQLAARGVAAILADLLADLQARDARDSSRTTAPLKAAEDAQLLDNGTLTVEQSIDTVLAWWQSKQPF
jgi:3-phosphoshikimate 1-carboxyvinyltransferase